MRAVNFFFAKSDIEYVWLGFKKVSAINGKYEIEKAHKQTGFSLYNAR